MTDAVFHDDQDISHVEFFPGAKIMPLTAYSRHFQKELDVEQFFRLIAQATQTATPLKAEELSQDMKQWIKDTTECPCCFVTGAEIVREAVSRGTGKPVRQQCFRFSKPGHHSLCDFAGANDANSIPANLVAFGTPKTALTRAVRDLVCAGIHLGAFSATTIRDMREWFFKVKSESQFIVSLDPRVPAWAGDIWSLRGYAHGYLQDSFKLTKQISSIPGFVWKAEARRTLAREHASVLGFLERERLWAKADHWQRISQLARRYQNEAAFDPMALRDEYRAATQLAHFMAINYTPLERAYSPNKEMDRALLAFAALLLFVSQWDLDAAGNLFATISVSVGTAGEDLANVMGLNPFHDYLAWNFLKLLQDANLPLPLSFDVKAQVQEVEDALRRQFT